MEIVVSLLSINSRVTNIVKMSRREMYFWLVFLLILLQKRKPYS